jgi:hypothetical protein
MDIPLDPTTSPQNLIQFDDGTTKLVPALKMPSLIPKPPEIAFNSSHLLPPLLSINSKITFKHKGQFHKGYLTKSPEGTFCFSYKSSHTSTRNNPIGVFLYPTSCLLGTNNALLGFYCPVTLLAALFGTHHLPTLSA